jgi:hypothetical protein
MYRKWTGSPDHTIAKTITTSLGRPQLKWKDILTYNSLAEFELLQNCQEDIRCQLWTDAVNRQVTLHILKLEQAKKERSRLNVEIAHLMDWMSSEENTLRTAIAHLHESHLPLAIGVEELLTCHSWQNIAHRRHIYQIYQLLHYKGSYDPTILSGIWTYPPFGTSGSLGGDGEEGNSVINETPDVEEDDLLGEELDKVNDFLGSLGIIND